MKRFLFILLAFASFALGNAQKLHTIIFADTNDPKIGKGQQIDVNLFLDFSATTASALGLIDPASCPEPLVYTGFECNRTNLDKVLNDYTYEPNDIVLFGYFGHGARKSTDTSEFPRMCLASNKISDFFPLEDVKNTLLKKGAGFVFVIGDCCNNYIQMTKSRSVVNAQDPSVLNAKDVEFYKKLFLKKGSVIAAGCQKGEYSWTNSVDGSFFTNSLMNMLDAYIEENPSEPSWDILMQRVRNDVVEYSRKQLKNYGGYVQTPIYEITNGRKIQTDTTRTPIQDNGSIKNLLLILVDKKTSLATRISHRSSAINQFAQNAKVEILGRDGVTLFAVRSASDYINSISLSPTLVNFRIIDEQKDASGKISLLKLHEIYIKK